MILIAIEGLDGMGKTTLARELHAKIIEDLDFCRWAYMTREPGLLTYGPGLSEFERPGVDFRSIIKKGFSLNPLERELVLYADASQHKRFIDAQGDAIIVSDRGRWSHYAYMKATLKAGLIPKEAYSLCKDLIDLMTAPPTKVVYLKGSVQMMRQRNKEKDKDPIEALNDLFFEHVFQAYDDLAFENPDCLTLPASLTTMQMVESVLHWLKRSLTNEQLRSGSL